MGLFNGVNRKGGLYLLERRFVSNLDSGYNKKSNLTDFTETDIYYLVDLRYLKDDNNIVNNYLLPQIEHLVLYNHNGVVREFFSNLIICIYSEKQEKYIGTIDNSLSELVYYGDEIGDKNPLNRLHPITIDEVNQYMSNIDKNLIKSIQEALYAIKNNSKKIKIKIK